MMTREEVGCEIFRWYTECALQDGCTTAGEIVVWILDCLAGRLPALATPQGQAALQAAVIEQLESSGIKRAP